MPKRPVVTGDNAPLSATPLPARESHYIASAVGHNAPGGAIAATVTCACGRKFEAPTTLWGDILRAFNKHRRGDNA